MTALNVKTASELESLPEGRIDHEARLAVRNLIRVHGFETARELIAGYLMDELDRKGTRQ